MPSYIIVILGTFAKNAFIQQTPTADIIVGANDAELDKLLKLWAAEQYKSEIKPPVSDVFATSVPTCKEVKLDVNGAVIVDTASTVDTINTATATDTFETVSGTIFIKFAENTSKRAEIVYRAGWWMKTDQTIAVVYKSDKPQYTQKDIDDLQLTITNLKNENETSKQETEYALDKTGNLLNTIATLEMQISSQKSLDATISGIEKVLDEMHESRKILSSDLLNSKQTNSELTDELNRANEQINTLVGMNQTMINRINENDEQIAELNDRIRDEQTKNTFIAQEIHAMYGDYIKQMKEKHNDIVSAFRDANASLQTRYEAQIHALNDKIAELKHSDVKPVKFTAIKQGSYDDVVEELKGFKLSSLRRVQKSCSTGDLLEFENSVDDKYEESVRNTFSEYLKQTDNFAGTVGRYSEYTINPILFRQISAVDPKQEDYDADISSDNCSTCDSCSEDDDIIITDDVNAGAYQILPSKN